jgi:KaiC/GvpD/RAD55 family RecA-like ATPase
MDLSNSEHIVIRNILEDPTYLDIVKPDFFKNDEYRLIIGICKDFWEKYKSSPSKDQINEAVKIYGKTEEIKESSIDSIFDVDLARYESDWLIETTQFFIEYKNLTKSAVDALKYLQSTPVSSENIKSVIENFKSIINDRNTIDFSFDEGLDFFEASNHKQPTFNTFSSGYPFIDTVLGGGFSAKALYVFMGMPKVGKSLWMGNLAVQAVKSGHNVAVISLEMNDRKYMKRLGSNMLGIPVGDYKNSAEDDQLIKKKLQSVSFDNFKIPGKFYVKEYPTSQASVHDIERYLRKIEEIKKIKFKVVIVDYINIMKNWRNPNSENTYMKIKQIAEDLRGIAMANEWAIITATQTKQSDFDSSDLSINSAAESSGLVATVDGMFGIIQDPMMYANREYKLKLLANREDGYKNSYKTFKVDYKYMRIIEDTNTPMHTE